MCDSIESMRFPGQVLDIAEQTTADGASIFVQPRTSPQIPNQKWLIMKPTIDTIAMYGW